MAVLLFGWVLSDLRSKWMLDSGLDLRPMVRHVAVAVPVPAILWYDSLHPNAGLKILAGAAAATAIWDWARQRKRSGQVGAGQSQKRVSHSKAADGFSVVIDHRSQGGYTAWSADDDDLRVEAPTLLAVDEQVRRYLHDRLVGDEKQELSLAYVWEDSERATPAAAGGLPSYKFSRPPRSLYFDVRESPGEGYLAEGESGLGIAAQTLEGLAPAARAEIARRWPDAMANDMPRVTFGWVRMAQV
ncbi:MAG: hypothetical protein E6J01_02940 [Chloroflexi bacterium]|nr:MAG: hypothetical protein E6J01_02940 [Chloroflexota bacterium]